MKRAGILLLVGCAICGCQGGEPAAIEGSAPSAPPQVVHVVSAVSQPETDSPTKIGIVVRKGPAITVGYDRPSKVFDSFRDPRTIGSEFNDLPAKFQFPYRARTWETSKMGFGEILYNDALVGALYHEDFASDERVQEIVDAHKEQTGKPAPDREIVGKRVHYWFWELGNQRLMICAYQKDQKGFELTVAMGDDIVMKALNIAPDIAQTDLIKIDAATTPIQRPLTTSTPAAR